VSREWGQASRRAALGNARVTGSKEQGASIGDKRVESETRQNDGQERTGRELCIVDEWRAYSNE
jgi:hypothetical protein